MARDRCWGCLCQEEYKCAWVMLEMLMLRSEA
jgi:hypothetical protein